MFLQRVLGGATACSAEAHAAVRTELCVTLPMALANADWAGLDPAVTQVRPPNVGILFMGNQAQQQTTKLP